MLAFNTCIESGVRSAQDQLVETKASFAAVRSKVFETLARRFRRRTEDFAKGTRLRREGRAHYLHLRYWLGISEEWTLSLDQAIRLHPELRGSLIQIIEKDYLLALMDSVPAIGEVLHFEQSSKLLTVEDPQYIFFLRNVPWRRFASDLGYLSVDFQSRSEFAFAFAGTEHHLAENVF